MLHVLYLIVCEYVSTSWRGRTANILPATAMALDGGTLLFVSILRKAGNGIFLIEASAMILVQIMRWSGGQRGLD